MSELFVCFAAAAATAKLQRWKVLNVCHLEVDVVEVDKAFLVGEHGGVIQLVKHPNQSSLTNEREVAAQDEHYNPNKQIENTCHGAEDLINLDDLSFTLDLELLQLKHDFRVDVPLVFHLLRIEPLLVPNIFFVAPKRICFWPPGKPLVGSFEYVVSITLSCEGELIWRKRNRVDFLFWVDNGVCVGFQIRLFGEKGSHDYLVFEPIVNFGSRLANGFVVAFGGCDAHCSHVLVRSPCLVVALHIKTLHIKTQKSIRALKSNVFPHALVEFTFLEIFLFTWSSWYSFRFIKFSFFVWPLDLVQFQLKVGLEVGYRLRLLVVK